MQDNARPHVDGVCQQFLQDKDTDATDWPTSSPDLNLIQHIGNIMSYSTNCPGVGRHFSGECGSERVGGSNPASNPS